MPAETLESQKTECQTLGKTIGRIAAIIDSDNFPTGDRAAFKRMTPGIGPPLCFYRFAFRNFNAGWEYRKEDWITIAAGLSLMCPNPNSFKRPAGRALAENGYSEKRLERLLSADGDVLRTLILRAARFLAAKGESVNWTDFARLLLTKKRDSLEKAKMSIAADYYRYTK